MLRALCDKNSVETEPRAQCLSHKVGSFDSDLAVPIPAGVDDGSTQFFQAAVLLTLYNTKRHLKRTISALSRFYAVFDPLRIACDANHLPGTAGCDSFRLCGVSNCGVFLPALLF